MRRICCCANTRLVTESASNVVVNERSWKPPRTTQDTSGASTSNQSAEEAVTSERLAESSRLLHLSDSEAWHEAVRAAARMSQPDQASLEHKLAGLRVIADIARSRALRRHERADEGDADVEGDPHSTDDIVTLGVVVAALVVCAEQFPRSEEVQALWTGILCNFAYSTTLPLPHDCRVAVAAILSCRGGVETVVAAMQRFPAHVMIQSNLAKALTMCLADIDVMPKTGGPPGSRVSQYSSTTSLILDSGIVEAVLASLGAMLLRPAQRSQATVGDGPPMCAAGPWDEARGAVFFLLRLVSGRHFSALRDRFLRRALLLGEEHAAAAAAAEAAGGGAGAAVAAAICQAIRLEVSLWAFAAAAGNPPPLRPLFVVSEFVDALVMLLIKSRQETEAAAAAAPRPPFARVLVRSKAPQQLLRLISSVLSSTHDPSTVSFDLLSGAVDLFEAVAVSAARDPSGLTLEPAILAEGVIVVSRLLMSLRPVALYVVEGSGKDSCPGVFNTYDAALAALRAVAAVPAARGWKIGESFSGPGSDAWGVQSGPEWNMTFLSVCTACRPLAGPTSAVEPKAVAALADLLHDFFAPLNVCAWRVDVILRTGLFSDVFKVHTARRANTCPLPAARHGGAIKWSAFSFCRLLTLLPRAVCMRRLWKRCASTAPLIGRHQSPAAAPTRKFQSSSGTLRSCCAPPPLWFSATPGSQLSPGRCTASAFPFRCSPRCSRCLRSRRQWPCQPSCRSGAGFQHFSA